MFCTTYGKAKRLLGALEICAKTPKTKWFLLVIAGTILFMTGNIQAQQMPPERKAAVIGFGSPDIRYEQLLRGPQSEEAGTASLKDHYNLIAWKAERVSMQIVIEALEDLSNLEITSSALTLDASADGKRTKKGKIAAAAIQTGFIRYVLSNGIGKSGSGCGIDTSVQHLAHIVADGIDYTKQTKLEGNHRQPIWLTLKVPSDAVPGTYKGEVEIAYNVTKGEAVGASTARQRRKLTYEVQVKNRTLPAAAQWKFHLDLWQYPASVARWYHLDPWSKQHFAKMKPYMKMLADAGQKVITTSIINDPWGGQTYDPYPSMVEWTKKKDGSWSYDYSIFDKWVGFMMGLGIDQQINCYSMVPWNNTFSYYDEASDRIAALVTKPGSAEYNAFWGGMLKDFASHLKKKGWFEKTTIAMDERPLEAMEKVIQLIKGLPDPFKISLAGSYHRSLDKDIYDYSITTREHYDQEVLNRRNKAGLPTTYYTCCTEDHPNTFSFSPPAEGAFIPLLSAARNLSGYLRWAFDAWPEHPLTDSRFGSWSSGDTYFVYPGPGSSIRFEQLIRGIQDFEKIRLLKAEMTAGQDKAGLQKINQVLGNCTVDQLRKTGASAIVGSVEAVINKF